MSPLPAPASRLNPVVLLVAATVVSAGRLPAQDDRPQPLFESTETLEMRLSGDFHAITRDVGDDRSKHYGAVTYLSAAGDTVTLNVMIRTRGRFRRDRDVCDFPPLRLDFKTKEFGPDQLEGTLFENQNRLKLVCHCLDGREEYQQLVLKEYLLYRTYALLTERSFRVRLARVTYVDRSGRRDSTTQYAFFIEDEGRMARRNGAEVVDSAGVSQAATDDAAATLLAMFQYFAGNTDWKVSALHNIVLLRPQSGFPVPVPYDFDWAGFVDPPYAVPHPALGTFDVKKRVFISPCRTDYDLERVRDLFLGRKEEIYALYRHQPGLEPRTLARTLEYADGFYEILNDPRRFRREFVRSCPGG